MASKTTITFEPCGSTALAEAANTQIQQLTVASPATRKVVRKGR